jgi:hypothetical protein
MGKGFRCLSFALIGIALILVGTGTAFAHTWPSGATSTGVTISLTALRTSDGTTPTGAVLPGTVNQCETIIYRATIGFAGGSNAAIFGGTITITTPDAVIHDVTPAGGVPCLGPSDLAEVNSENCTGTLEVDSNLQPFTLTVASCPATVTATVNYTGGTSHIGATNTPGNSASTTLPLTVACCSQDNTVCNGAEFCDPAVTFTDPNTGFGRRGTCAAGTPLNCDDNNACTADSCDPVTGCQHGAPDACDDNNACTADSCDPVLGCQHGAPNACDDNNVCTADSCDPVLGCQHGTPNACDDNNACTRDSCDPVSGCANVFDPTLPGCSPSVPGRMTGGGSVFTKGGTRVTHGFELHCDPTVLPNNLEINWDGGNNFHLTALISATCTDEPGLAPPPPAAGFDTYVGTGTGSCNGVPGASITFTLTDAGEPGGGKNAPNDTATFEITGCPGGLTLTVSGDLKKGNQQAHKN